MTLLKCPTCNHTWDYGGKHINNPLAKVICPACRNIVKIADNKTGEE